MRVIVLVSMVLAFFHTAMAADFTAKPIGDGAIIFLSGPIVEGDEVTFRNLVAGFDKGIVALVSQGGKVLPAVNIGTLIRSKHFNTVVADGKECASSCALIWLGGGVRFMGPTAHIGFHAASLPTDNGDRAVTGAGNAIIGAYMARLGFSYQAVNYATMAGPQDIQWLTMADAQSNGISFQWFEADAPAPPVAQQPPQWFVPNQQQRPALRPPVATQAPQAVAIGPSFDCARADRPVMKFICADADLSRIDVVFLQPYYVLRHQVGPSGWKALMVEAIDFQNATEASCGISPTGDLPADLGALKNCMYIQYTKQRAIWMARLSVLGLQEASRSIEAHILLQTRLQLLGYIPPTDKIDGIYGTGTRAAIISWQIAASRQPTGLLGDSDAYALAQSEYHAQR